MKAAIALVFMLLGISFARPRAPRNTQMFSGALQVSEAIAPSGHTSAPRQESRAPQSEAQQAPVRNSGHYESANSAHLVVQNSPQKTAHLSLLGLVGLGSLAAGLIMKR